MIIETVKKGINLIGRLGENESRVMRFYVGDTQRDFPGCSFAVVNRRPNDAEAYPVNSSYYTVEGEYLLWTVMSGDLTQEGIGECEIIAYVNSKIAKSEIYMTRILRALDGAGDPPDPWQSWVQDVTDAADRAEAAAELLEHPGAQAMTLDPGSEALANYDDGVFYFGIPRGEDGTDGEDGHDGYSPSASVSKSGPVATISITDKNGTTTAQVTDGTDGRDGTDGHDGYSPTASVSKSGDTATISITDKNGTTTAQITDGQDGATGATPVISIGTVTTLSPGSDATASMDVTDPEHPVLSFGIPEGEPGEVTEAELSAVAESKADVITDTASGAIASFPDGANGMPVKSLVIGIEPVQSGSGDPAPDNVRPITGWTGCNVTRTGKNLLKIPQGSGTMGSDNAITITTSEGIISVSGTSISYGTYNIDLPITIPKGATVKLSGTESGSGIAYRLRNKTTGEYIGIALNSVEKVLELPADRFQVASSPNIQYAYTVTNVQLELGSTSSSYEPYQGEVYNITFPSSAGTVYGGTLTVNKDGTGKLVSDMVFVDLDNLSWTKHGTNPRIAYTYVTDHAKFINKTTPVNGVSSIYKVIAQTQDDPNVIGISFNTEDNVYIRDDNISELNSSGVSTYLAGQKLAYELATPVEIDLTDLEVIETLKGVNNVWADCGPVSVEYPADTKLYIDKSLSASRNLMELIITANHEDSMKATKAYTTGNLLIVNGTLYKATTSIANGATLTVGTNVTATTVAAELAALA